MRSGSRLSGSDPSAPATKPLSSRELLAAQIEACCSTTAAVSDRLGHAGNAEQGVGLHRSPGFAIRHAEPPSIDEAAMPEHRNRGAGNVEVAHDAGDDAVVGLHRGDRLPGLRNAEGAGYRRRLGMGGKRRHGETGSEDKGGPHYLPEPRPFNCSFVFLVLPSALPHIASR